VSTARATDGVSPNNPYAPSLPLRASQDEVPRWESALAWMLCAASCVSTMACAWLVGTLLSHYELRSFPFNRVALLASFQLVLSLAQALRVPLGVFGMADSPAACAVVGHAYIASSLAVGGTLAMTGLTSAVSVCAPLRRDEGCASFSVCFPNALVFASLSLFLPITLNVIQALTLDKEVRLCRGPPSMHQHIRRYVHASFAYIQRV
jgi:hypothetical protein